MSKPQPETSKLLECIKILVKHGSGYQTPENIEGWQRGIAMAEEILRHQNAVNANHQPEQKSETPRTDALRKTYFGISNANPETLLLHHEQLELELDAARSEVAEWKAKFTAYDGVLNRAFEGDLYTLLP